MQSILETSCSKYVILDKIGDGATCTVFKGYILGDSSKKLFAIKIFDLKAQKYYEKEMLINNYLPQNQLKNFLEIYNCGDGFIRYEIIDSNIIYSSKTNKSLEKYRGKIFYIVEELCENGELFNYIYELKQGFSEQISAKIFSKILNSLKILHENRIVHRDIKPENIIIGNDFNVKLIDFGFSEILGKEDNFLYDYKGSEIYSSPEIRNRQINGYDGIKSDIFSMGVLLFVITVGRFPFEKCGYTDRKYRLIMNKKFEDFWCYYQQYNLTKEFKNLIEHLLCYDPSERYSIDEIYSHQWIKNNIYSLFDNNNNDINDIEIVEELRKRKERMQDKEISI
jgi:serine/threonine protein kinase